MRNLLTLIFAIFIVSGYAQEFEVGLKGGVTLFHGDLVEEVFDLDELGYGAGLFARYHFNPRFAFRAAANYGEYTGSDLNSAVRFNRGFSSTSTLIDLSVGAEWNLLGVRIYENQKRNSNDFTPYLFLGVGGSMADVEVTTKVDGNLLDPVDALRENPSFSMVVPMGLGIRYSLPRLVVGIEGTLTAGLNDYLDGISRSGNQNDNDWYTFVGVTVSYRIGETSSSFHNTDEPIDYLEEGEEMLEEDLEN